MRRILVMLVAFAMMVCAPYTFFPGQPEWYKLEAKKGAPKKGTHKVVELVTAEATQGHGHGHSSHGGGEGHGGSTNGGGSTSSGSVSAPSVSVDGASVGGLIITGGAGVSTGDRAKLAAAVKACEQVRPGLALGDTTSMGGWSFRTYDDTVWPYVERCMRAQGYPSNGADYSAPTNFGTR